MYKRQGDTPCVVFTGATDKFVFDGASQNLGESFKGMLPGESRTQKILLENADQRAVEIYFNTNVLKEPDAKGAVYVIRFKVNGEIFAQGKVGGATGKLEDVNDSSISSHSQGEKLYLCLLYTSNTLMDQEEVAHQFQKYDFTTMPVVDSENRLVGIITVDDIVDIMQQEATEDIEMMAAITPTDKPYMKEGVFDTWKKRIPLLLLLDVYKRQGL